MTGICRALQGVLCWLAMVCFFDGPRPALADPVGGIPVLFYHQISTPEHPLPLDDTVVDVAAFSRQMQFLHDSGYRTIGTAELMGLIKSGGHLPEKTVAIHFDDGWKTVLAAVPILEKYKFKAAFWIVVNMVGVSDYLNWDDLAGLVRSSNYEIYSHTMSHSWHGHSDLLDWSADDPGKVDWELRESKRQLEQRLGRPVPFLAWPYGEYNDALIRAASEAGYQGLFTVEWGLTKPGQDPLRIPRSYVSGLCDLDTFMKVLEDGHSRTCPLAAVATQP